MATLTIITQNLDEKVDGTELRENEWVDLDDAEIVHKIEEKYNDASVKECYKNVDIYAVQELKIYNKQTKRWRMNTKTLIKKEKYQKDMSISGRAEEIWDDAFPWLDFRGGYWDECDIEFAGKKIKIINFHSSPTYDLGPRYTLLKRLSEIKK